MIKERNKAKTFFMEINTDKIDDIQSRACEVLVALIDKNREFPKYNYIFKVTNSVAYIGKINISKLLSMQIA